MAAAALLGTVLAPAAASVPPERVALQARVDAVRAALAVVPEAAAVNGADVSATAWLLAQATNWTNWPKWSKWSNWANK